MGNFCFVSVHCAFFTMLLLFSCQSFVSFVKVLSPLWKFFFDFVVMAGRPGAPIRIVPQAHILNDHAILMEKWTVFTLQVLPIFSRTQLGQLEFLAARRCISNEMPCAKCGALCGLTRRQESSDGFRWRCRLYVRSVRGGSFFP